MMKVMDIVYHHHAEYDRPQPVLEKHAPAMAFADFIGGRFDLEFVKHLNFEGSIDKGVKVSFFRGAGSFFHIPLKTHRHVRKQKPDVVIVEGFIFPWQLLWLRLALSGRCKIILQHHGERPFRGIKKYLQRFATGCADRFLFTSLLNAREWIEQGIIRDQEKCREVLEASTFFTGKEKTRSREKLYFTKKYNYLWVGRLDANKDPLNVLRAFEQFSGSDADLWMVYQEKGLLNEVKNIIRQSGYLTAAVKLVGKVEHCELEDWFSAADFYLSGSHKEGSGYALLEAMACGCIPIVTSIPSFQKIMGDQYEFLYAPGNNDELLQLLSMSTTINIDHRSKEIQRDFRERLTFKNIADDLCAVISQLQKAP